MMNDCCRAAVVAELRAHSSWLYDHALSLGVGDPFCPGICLAAGSLKENADIIESRTEAAPGDVTDSCSTCGAEPNEPCRDGCAYAARTGWRELPEPTAFSEQVRKDLAELRGEMPDNI